MKGSLKQWPIEIIEKEEPGYPEQLKKIDDGPDKLYVRGKIPDQGLFFGIVGTRRCSDYGKEIAFSIAKGLSQAGVVVTSGMARGIDTFAHKGALEGKGITVAILGTGLAENRIYPQQNLGLAQEILAKGGALISEYEPQIPGSRFTFPRRNRIIAGMAAGVLVVEAGYKSGALITAEYAKKQQRQLFAVPGNIHKVTSKGTNELIKQGALLTETANDILKQLKIQKMPLGQGPGPNQVQAENPIEAAIITALQQGAMSIDKIIEETGLPSQKVSAALSEMEIDDKVMSLGGNTYGLQ